MPHCTLYGIKEKMRPSNKTATFCNTSHNFVKIKSIIKKHS
jgi:hypothetical protein